MCGHGHPGADQHCAPVLQQGNLVHAELSLAAGASVANEEQNVLVFVKMTPYTLWCVFSWNASPGCARKPRGSWPLTSETGRIGPRTRCVCYYCAWFLPRNQVHYIAGRSFTHSHKRTTHKSDVIRGITTQILQKRNRNDSSSPELHVNGAVANKS